MSLDLFIPFLIATAILLATLGPTILLVVSCALAQGGGVGLAVVGGVIPGDLPAMSATLLGLGVIMTASAGLFTVMKSAGVAYLAWMVWRMIRSEGRTTVDLAEVAGKTKVAAFRDSALVTFLNPKSISFFAPFVPQFIDPAAPFTPQFTVMIATLVGLDGVNTLAHALLAATLRSKVARPDRMAWLQRGSGAVLIGLAIFTTTLRRA